jgi:3-dehydroquinate synthase
MQHSNTPPVLNARVTVSPTSAEPESHRYDVLIGPRGLDELPRLLKDLVPASRYALISDRNVASLYGAHVAGLMADAGLVVDRFDFPAGEANKNREVWSDLSDRMLDARYGRDSAVLALGGGVTGDLAGFVAATYMRGLPLVQLPTTVLAMIDSSVGGKTGVDTPGGKNLIGAFLQPRLVLADTDTLRTLPEAEIRAGLAEAIKHGAIADRDYFEWIAGSVELLLGLDPAALVRLIGRSVEIKAGVVGADEREHGLRKTLNFGHTIGHAIEAQSRFSLLHGEAIAIGMVVEAEIGEALGVTASGTAERIRQTLTAFGLPVAVPADFATTATLDLTRADKKARAGRVEYALLEDIGVTSPGTGAYGIAVDDETAAEALVRCRRGAAEVSR